MVRVPYILPMGAAYGRTQQKSQDPILAEGNSVLYTLAD